MFNWFACFPAGHNILSSRWALIVIRYVVKARGNRDHEARSVLATVLSLPVMILCDHLMWHWPLTWLVCVPASEPPRVYLLGRYCGRPAVNSAGPHCYVTAAGSTVTHVKEAENDLIHSTTSLAPPPPRLSPPPPPPSIPLSSFCLRSIYYSICLFHRRCSWHLHTCRRERWIPRQGGNLTT